MGPSKKRLDVSDTPNFQYLCGVWWSSIDFGVAQPIVQDLRWRADYKHLPKALPATRRHLVTGIYAIDKQILNDHRLQLPVQWLGGWAPLHLAKEWSQGEMDLSRNWHPILDLSSCPRKILVAEPDWWLVTIRIYGRIRSATPDDVRGCLSASHLS